MKTKMKKLKLFGAKYNSSGFSGPSGFIAEIYVKDNKILVDSKDEKLREEILARMNKVIKEEKGFWLPAPDSPPDIYYGKPILHNIDDPGFLDALLEHFTSRGKIGCLINEYLIIPLGSKIIEDSISNKKAAN